MPHRWRAQHYFVFLQLTRYCTQTPYRTLQAGCGTFALLELVTTEVVFNCRFLTSAKCPQSLSHTPTRTVRYMALAKMNYQKNLQSLVSLPKRLVKYIQYKWLYNEVCSYSSGWLLARDAIRRAPKGQPARSPGQSEASPWVMNT